MTRLSLFFAAASIATFVAPAWAQPAAVTPTRGVTSARVSSGAPVAIATLGLGGHDLELQCGRRAEVAADAGEWTRRFGLAARRAVAGGQAIGCRLAREGRYLLALPVARAEGGVVFLVRPRSDEATAYSLLVPTTGLVDTDFVFGLAATLPARYSMPDVQTVPLTAAHAAPVLAAMHDVAMKHRAR